MATPKEIWTAEYLLIVFATTRLTVRATILKFCEDKNTRRSLTNENGLGIDTLWHNKPFVCVCHRQTDGQGTYS